jgi:hypothetical protein
MHCDFTATLSGVARRIEPMFRIVSRLSMLVLCVATVACSSNTTSSPTGPSTNSRAASPSPTVGSSYGTVATTAFAEGTISGLTGACPAVTFMSSMTRVLTMISMTRVLTDSTTTFFDGTCQQLANGGKAEVRGAKQPDGSIKATRVSVEEVRKPGPTEVDGTISGLAGACPAVTFTIGTTKVSTDSTTRFSDGTCQQLANGGKVEVKGSKQPDGSIKASELSLDRD